MKLLPSALLAPCFFLAGLSAGNATCAAAIDTKYYLSHGGKLQSILPEGFWDLPPNFFCDRLACEGDVLVSFLIDDQGAVKNVQVIGNSWTMRPEWHEAISVSKISGLRYRPPRMHGKSVCVRHKFRYLTRVKD